MFKLQRFVFNPFYENTYIVWDSESKHAAVIDPGCYDDKERRVLDDFILENELNLEYIINTHCHIDHVLGNSYLKSKYNSKLLVPTDDVFLLNMLEETARQYHVVVEPSPEPDILLKDGDAINIGEFAGIFLYTPGHTPGEMCLYFEKEKICFTGDVLFRESIGRTDLEGGNTGALMHSIRTKLFTLPDDVAIYPGHESYSTIGYEKQHNPFLR